MDVDATGGGSNSRQPSPSRTALSKRGVTPLETIGTDFDPHFHQAVVQEASPQHREGEVIEEFRRGYILGTRLLRAAMVKVAKA